MLKSNNMDIYEKITQLNQDITKIPRIKKYLLACCAKYAKYRSSGELIAGIEVASQFIVGRATWQQLHDYEWRLEGEAFGIEYYAAGINYFKFHPDKAMLNDLRKIRIQQRLGQKEALAYLEMLAYFIVYVFSYCYRASNDLPPKQYRQFLCPNLFKKYF